ncbi:MAG: glycoside hydrolase family 27 protein [Gordonia sp. (in: high G+C Gram-positive bacteria)]
MLRAWLCVVVLAAVSGCAATPSHSPAASSPAGPARTSSRPLPPMGWNSWNSGMHLDEKSVKDTIDAIVSSGLRDAGYRYVNLDAGWAAARRSADGTLVADPVRFPHGLAPLAAYAHSRKLLFGIYSSPFNKTCGQDPGAASIGHEQRDAATFAAWGVDYLKYDWCARDADHAHQVSVFRAMRDALRATGRHIVYSINPNSSGDATAGTRYDWSGIADVVRTSGDLIPLWHGDLPRIGPTKTSHKSTNHGVPDAFYVAASAPWRQSYVNDPDMLVIGLSWQDFFLRGLNAMRSATKPLPTSPKARAQAQYIRSLSEQQLHKLAAEQPSLTDAEQRTHLSLWAMMGAPLIAGNDVRSMSAATAAILTNREVIAVDQDTLGGALRPVGTDRRVWVRHLADGSVAVLLFNNSDAATTVATTTAALHLPTHSCYTVRDLWAHNTSTSTTGELRAPTLAPHAVRMLRITPGCTS